MPFRLVVEPQEATLYSARFGADRLLILPFSNLGLGGIPARNWVWEHAKRSGAERHWIMDDNIDLIERRHQTYRIPCDAGIALRCCEQFVDRYENVAIAGLNYHMFVLRTVQLPPFFLNNHVYSCLLILNSLSQRWRGRYNEDTDLCLQVLSAGWCTVLFNAFMIYKIPTMTMKGGNTADLYKADGRLKMARSLERSWPGVVTVGRRFHRPQHVVKDAWRKFDTPLKLRPGVDLAKLPKIDEHGLQLVKLEAPKSEHAPRRHPVLAGRDEAVLDR